MNEARQRILDRLRATHTVDSPSPPAFESDFAASGEARIACFVDMIEAVRGKVLRVTGDEWLACLNDTLSAAGVKRLLLASTAVLGTVIRENPPPNVDLIDYDAPIESWKHELFCNVDGAFTSSIGGIAETGSIMLWPTVMEPRLMSLVPPLHIVLLDADKIYATFAEAMREQDWASNMPSNALLISGPSKSADIEQVLAYGVHGPKQLVVILRETI